MKRGIKRALALIAALLILLSSCDLIPPAATTAATMHLRQTEGTVSVSDGDGKDVEPREDLGLYSGYAVGTRRTSYAWIDLDKAKLAKLDEKSEIEIVKEDKSLEIEVLSGSLFFNVTEPLADDEVMVIRASTMAVGIRGTCGWVTLEDSKHMTLYLLEGSVECTTGEETATITAGEMAQMTKKGEITVSSFSEEDVPAFVMDELDEDLLETVRGFLPQEQGLSPEAQAALQSIHYYGNPANCAMTPEQASAFLQIIRDNIAELEVRREGVDASWYYQWTGEPLDSHPNMAFAALFDLGDGTPALMFSGGLFYQQYEREIRWMPFAISGIWLYQDGAAVQYAPDRNKQALYDGYLLTGGRYEDFILYSCQIHPIANGAISDQVSGTVEVDLNRATPELYDQTYKVDGEVVSKEEMDAWMLRWVGSQYDPSGPTWDENTSLAGFTDSTDVVEGCWGMSPAEDVIAALDIFAG